MEKTGRNLIPVIILIAFLCFKGIFASEIIVYTLPSQKADFRLNQRLSWKIPDRQFLSLNGEWQLKGPNSDQQIGKVNVPFSFSGGNQISLERQFELNVKTGSQVFFNAICINGWTKISINGQVLFQGSWNYLPLRREIPSTFLKPGQNSIQIELKPYERHNGQIPSWIPINLPRISSGILSSIYLEIAPAFHIKSVEVNPEISDSLVHFKGKVTVNRPVPTRASSKINFRYRSTEKVLFEGSAQITDSSSTEISIPEWKTDHILPWSVDHPKKYWVEVELDTAGKLCDQYRQEFAVRSVQTQNRELLLNGETIPVKGINYIYQTPDGNELFDPELFQQDLMWIKENGFNAVRVVLHPLPEKFYQLCDEMGLLCLQDLPFIFTGADKIPFEDWKSYYQHFQQLTGRFSSVVAAGMAFQIDGESYKQQTKLEQFLNTLEATPALRYVSSLNPGSELYENINFQLVEIIHRNNVEREASQLKHDFSGHPYFPAAFSKPVSYRADSTTITQDLVQIKSLFQEITPEVQKGNIPGEFILTYSDHYLDFPSLQNGGQSDLYICHTGLVDLKRQRRQFFKEVSNENETTSEAPLISEAKGARSYLYIILGLLNLFLFLYSYRRFTEFRHNVNYSMKKTHGFFVNLQERLIIPYGQSLLLVFVISLNGAIIWSSIAYYFRNNLLLDYLVSLLFFDADLKLWISRVIWNQPLFLVAGIAFFFIIFYGLALLTQLLSLFGEPRVTFRQSLAVSAWSAVPMLLLLPFGIIFYNLLLTMKSYWIIITVLLYFHVWVYFRWINGTRVLTERRYYNVLVIFAFLGLFITSIIIVLYQYQINLIDHLRFVYHLYR